MVMVHLKETDRKTRVCLDDLHGLSLRAGSREKMHTLGSPSASLLEDVSGNHLLITVKGSGKMPNEMKGQYLLFLDFLHFTKCFPDINNIHHLFTAFFQSTLKYIIWGSDCGSACEF